MLAPRWRVVVALFAVTSCIAAAVSTFGVFLPVLSDTFVWSRGAVSVALSISLVVGGVAAFVLGWLTAGPLAAWLIGRFGWRAAYVALGALIAVVGVPASLCVSYPPSAEARPVTAGSGARWPAGDRRLWYFVGSWGFLGFVYMMVTVHSVASARDRGVPLEQALLAVPAFAVGLVAIVAGWRFFRLGSATRMR